MTKIIPSERITLTTADNQSIAATVYPASTPKAQLIVAGATGVPQGFYRRFAEYASTQGYTTLTFDYRGIGQSKPEQLKGFRATFLDWAQYDLAAAVSMMSNSQLPLFMTGHSFGGHAFGLLPDYQKITALYTLGTGAGWHGWMPAPERYRIWLFWNMVLPPLVWWHGYLPSSLFGLGENLPLGVYQQWRKWCKYPHYFFDDPAMADITALYQRINIPIVAASALDDSWALPASRDAFMAGYKNAQLTRRNIDPQEGSGKIGHMGYFRQDARFLWDEMLTWFEQHAAAKTGNSDKEQAQLSD